MQDSPSPYLWDIEKKMTYDNIYILKPTENPLEQGGVDEVEANEQLNILIYLRAASLVRKYAKQLYFPFYIQSQGRICPTIGSILVSYCCLVLTIFCF